MIRNSQTQPAAARTTQFVVGDDMVTPQRGPRVRRSRFINVLAGSTVLLVCCIVVMLWVLNDSRGPFPGEDVPIDRPSSMLAHQHRRGSVIKSTNIPSDLISYSKSVDNCLRGIREERMFFPRLHDHSVVVACRKLHYKLPPYLKSNRYFVILTDDVKVRLVIGVLSNDAARRQAIRETWGKNVLNLYFVVAGDYDKIRQEFFKYSDLIWIDMEEDLFLKTGSTLAIVQRHVRNYDYVLKTEDDSYINIPVLLHELLPGGEAREHDYFGHCKENYTNAQPENQTASYCHGAGYILSPKFLKCIGEKVPHLRHYGSGDVAVGWLAKQCGVAAASPSSASEYKWQLNVGVETNLTGKILRHPVSELQEMKALHETIVAE